MKILIANVSTRWVYGPTDIPSFMVLTKTTEAVKEDVRRLASKLKVWIATLGCLASVCIHPATTQDIRYSYIPQMALCHQSFKLVAIKDAILTGYSNDPISINVRKWLDGKTALMTRAREGIVAADWRYYPPGTEIYIPGYGIATVEDKGGAIKGDKRFDLFFATRRQALKWGIKRREVYIFAETRPSQQQSSF